MQQEAMAKAAQTRRKRQALRIKAAPERMSGDEYGYRTECCGDIPLKRLEEPDPAVPTCISCVSG